MTRNEAIEFMKTVRTWCTDGSKYHEAVDMAIEALKQDDVLREVRQEIDETPIGNKGAYEITLLSAYQFRVREIIDKHIGDME